MFSIGEISCVLVDSCSNIIDNDNYVFVVSQENEKLMVLEPKLLDVTLISLYLECQKISSFTELRRGFSPRGCLSKNILNKLYSPSITSFNIFSYMTNLSSILILMEIFVVRRLLFYQVSFQSCSLFSQALLSIMVDTMKQFFDGTPRCAHHTPSYDTFPVQNILSSSFFKFNRNQESMARKGRIRA